HTMLPRTTFTNASAYGSTGGHTHEGNICLRICRKIDCDGHADLTVFTAHGIRKARFMATHFVKANTAACLQLKANTSGSAAISHIWVARSDANAGRTFSHTLQPVVTIALTGT